MVMFYVMVYCYNCVVLDINMMDNYIDVENNVSSVVLIEGVLVWVVFDMWIGVRVIIIVRFGGCLLLFGVIV